MGLLHCKTGWSHGEFLSQCPYCHLLQKSQDQTLHKRQFFSGYYTHCCSPWQFTSKTRVKWKHSEHWIHLCLVICVCACVLDAGDVGRLGIISMKSQIRIIPGTRLASPRETCYDLVEAHFRHWHYSGGQRPHFTTRPYLLLEHLCLSTAKHVHPSWQASQSQLSLANVFVHGTSAIQHAQNLLAFFHNICKFCNSWLFIH